tara:strand:+ start:727 stop:891 length:165 start_codon:yes stop_codon:yes gene_type:complete
MNKIKKKTSSYNMGGSMPMMGNMAKKPMAKPGVMTYNLGGMVKSQTNNLKKKTA